MVDLMTTVGQVAEIFDGPHATPVKTDAGPFFLSISSLEKGRLDLSKSARVSEEDFKKWTKRVTPRKGDLLFSYETRLGEAALMPDGVRACLGRRMGLLRPRSGKVIPEYLLYAYLSPAFQQRIVANTITGATVDRIALNEMPKFPIRIPGIEKQKKVAGLLKDIDAKIDCNNRINAELEAMTKTLYDYWFVQFDFPDANGKPFKSSGGQMVFNPTLKREIPKGWCDSSVLAVADLLGGGTPTKKNPEFWGGDIPFFTPTDAGGAIFKFSTADYITEEGLKGSSTKRFGKHTVFITARGSVGRLVLAGVDMAMNQSCYALRPKPGISHVFLFFLAKELIHHLQVKSSGSVFDSIVSTDIELTNLAIPTGEVIEKFAAAVEPAFEKIAINTRANQQLSQLRDWLLPLLMNGQVTAH
ncbi:MAG TPA: restriction endonuclease subunit S [Polaromonas sp.]|uniref:restriction endonuclease subunit S n=1 Tax=Polaromonas sp. TaxID=1869339 RepID=UPI002D6FA357|nr:restriction endonuclease subunit S [Polaromonas sp.]HYW58507.1 restriction endonuclease subunit S [Polaromonas sp.]